MNSTARPCNGSAVGSWPFTVENRVQSQVGPCVTCGVQSGRGLGFCPIISVFSCQCLPANAPAAYFRLLQTLYMIMAIVSVIK